jgi:hypothetical protein
MAYKVVPFTAGLKAGEGASKAAAQLEELTNDLEQQGWKFRSLESLETIVTTPGVPGTSGCAGIGARPTIPEQRDRIRVYAAVFEK